MCLLQIEHLHRFERTSVKAQRAGEYACQLLKAGSAAQARGCGARFVFAVGVTGIIFVIHKLLTHRNIGYTPRCLLHASNTT